MKSKYLFVVSDFYPGGCQRESHELDIVLHKKGIKTEILCVSNLNDHEHFPDTYFEEHKSLGTPITFLNEIISDPSKEPKNALSRLFTKKENIFLDNYFNQFTEVIFFGEYTYKRLQKNISNAYSKQIKMFVVCSRFQGKKYREFNKKNNYLFIDGFEDGHEIEYEYEGFKQYEHILLPLSLNPTLQYKKWEYRDEKIKKIGIFTRLSKAKPLDPFLYSFSILQDRLPEIELHIYGSGTPEEAEYDRYIRHLNLKNVFFRGHQENLKQTINDDNLNLVWFQGYNQRPAGYAGLDVALTGTPQLFWDFFEGNNAHINDINTIYPHFKNINSFVNSTIDVLCDKELAEKISITQFTDTFENRNMETNCKVIEHLFSVK